MVGTLYLAATLSGWACGEDETAKEDANKLAKEDNDTKSAAGSSATPDATGLGALTTPPAPVKCGDTMCGAEGSGISSLLARPCCLDEANGVCGTSPITGGDCAKPVESDSRCPEVDVMGLLKLPSCCADNRCGIDGAMFGMPGCTDLKVASSQLPVMGFVTFPQPRTCDGMLDPFAEQNDDDDDAGVTP